LKGVGQQSLLLRFIGEVTCGHAHNLPSLRHLIALLPRSLLACAYRCFIVKRR
jgi:hypothetical protein